MKINVSHIQRFSLQDGPGIRTTVFLKGCTLNCFWCHNPETISSNRQIQFFKDKCIGCCSCKLDCPFNQCEKPKINNNQIELYEEFAEKCPALAIEIFGKYYEEKELEDILMRDYEFYEESNGGVTFSGGEPLLQSVAIRNVMQQLKEDKVNSIIETAGNVLWQAFLDVLPYTDLFFFDIKAYDAKLHKKGTGSYNNLILDNLDLLYKSGAKIVIRIPVIPKYNDSTEKMTKIAELLTKYPSIEYIEFMPYHNIGVYKYESLGLPYDYKDLTIPSTEIIENFKKIFINKKLVVK